ncbi:MAG TPA: EscU/YscU/HrcU family type III secretion system export apparatus switch protein, partial [Accumulibacter sp.]|nr:EscU/YscU/HrcU family type III secretion system export apparatus switch protein [Accumulibacter sp.]
MAEESDLERTEPASARRLEQAREEGQVPRSREIGAFLILLVAAVAFSLLGPWMVRRVAVLVRNGLTIDFPLAHEPQRMLTQLADLSITALEIFIPLLFALLAAALLAPFFLGSWNFSLKALQPDFSRIDPWQGLKRLVSWSGLAELVKALAKTALIGGVALMVLWNMRNDLP